MSFWRVQQPFSFDKPILKAPDHESTEALTIYDTEVSLDTTGKKVVPAGLFIARVNGVSRFLPRVNTTEDAASGDTAIKVDLQQVLKVGDVLQLLEQKAVLTMGGTFVVDDYVYLTFQTGSFAYKVTGTTPAAVATGLAEYINANRQIEARAVASAATVELYSVLGGPVTLSTNSASGTTVVTTPYAQQGFLGPISAINYETSMVTVPALAAALPAGSKVGVPTDEILGFHIHAIDFTYRDSCMVNAIHGAEAVYTDSFPYLDSSIRAQFPKIKFD